MIGFKMATIPPLEFSSYPKSSTYNKLKSTYKYGTLLDSRGTGQSISFSTRMPWES